MAAELMPQGSGRYVVTDGDTSELGAKAAALRALAGVTPNIPLWFVLSPRAHADGVNLVELPELQHALAALAPAGELLAVRSSSTEEDSRSHAFAGQFESYLAVPAAEVPQRIRDVWRSAAAQRVAAYRREHALPDSAGVPAVLVQRMVAADVSGVAFSANPGDGRRGVAVIAATYGLGNSVVSGEHDADSYQVDRNGGIIARTIARKSTAERVAAGGGTLRLTLGETDATAAVLSDEQVLAVAALARAAELHSGVPQDIEWAIEQGTLFLLQSRPITSLTGMADPDAPLCIWDNSNITESYGGVTTPLTYSFARYVYEEVYRQFCRLVGVSDGAVEGNADAFRSMIGLIRGRIYYNLASWYRTLALLPGFSINRRFMEQMMGVREPLPDEITSRIVGSGSRRARAADTLQLARTVVGLASSYRALPRTVRAFQRRLAEALDTRVELGLLRPDELVAHYRELELRLLRHWDAPLINDFFAMIFYGVLGKLCVGWCRDPSLHTDLIAADGNVVSAEPARRLRVMGALAAARPSLAGILQRGGVPDGVAALRADPELSTLFDDYIATFGDRCAGELKLETRTLSEDPEPVLRAVGSIAAAPPSAPGAGSAMLQLRRDAEERAGSALLGHPVRRIVFTWVLRHARARVRDRENLRFERTRVFGRVRRIFMELGRRFTAAGLLDSARDVFYLDVSEALGAVDGTTSSGALRGLAATRRAEFELYSAGPAPPERFQTRGMVLGTRELVAAPSAESIEAAPSGDVRCGTGCYPGKVRGPVRVVRDPARAALSPGEILVAECTDPGWVILFPAAAALLVERGSLLSHSAIVARELGLPAVIALPGLTAWLRTGDLVELDGRSGEVILIARGAAADGQ